MVMAESERRADGAARTFGGALATLAVRARRRRFRSTLGLLRAFRQDAQHLVRRQRAASLDDRAPQLVLRGELLEDPCVLRFGLVLHVDTPWRGERERGRPVMTAPFNRFGERKENRVTQLC